MPRCPVCSVLIDLEQTPTAPFCSDRCRTIDLGRWLDEAYGLPEPPAADDDEEGPTGEPPADDD
jgi:endogenous inhibitor of DNA gyrase (YacG/DUF329 family)